MESILERITLEYFETINYMKKDYQADFKAISMEHSAEELIMGANKTNYYLNFPQNAKGSFFR